MLNAQPALRRRVCCWLALGVLVGCSADPQESAAPRGFTSAELVISGGRCDDCFRSWRLHADRQAVLEDAVGELAIQVDPADYQAFEALIQSREFAQAWQRERETPSTCSLNALTNTLRIEWDGGTHETAVLSNGCKGHCDQPDHPLMRLKSQLFTLAAKHLDCPDIEPYLCANAPQVPTPAIGRMLCARCREDCGLTSSP